MLTPEQIAAREGRLTASRIACLMTGDPLEIHRLWQEMVGDPAFVPEDLSGNWAVQLGAYTESLNLSWYARKTGRSITRYGEVVVHPEYEWAACTLDGFDGEHVIECKQVGGREPRARIIERYAPQCVWQRIVTGCPVLMSIIEGADEPVIEPAAWDEDYAAEMLRRGAWFMQHVRDLTPPVELEPVAPPVPPERFRTVDLTNGYDGINWAPPMLSAAADWLDTAGPAKANESAAKAIKKILPDDVGLCLLPGVRVSRAKNAAISIKGV